MDSSQGARMEDVFKLIPRSDSVTRANNFTSYHSFFQFFDRVLGTTHTNVLHGKSKQFGFETSTKKKFITFGEQVCRGQKGTIEQLQDIAYYSHDHDILSKFVNYVEKTISGYLESNF